MDIGLLIYGSLNTLSGGYLYDRKLVEHLACQGDQVKIVSLPWRNYARCLTDNLDRELLRRLQSLKVDILLQDELNHPSLFWLNRRLKRSNFFPLVSIVHHLRSNERRPAWQNALYRQVERLYLSGVDGYVFNSQTTRQAVAQAGVNLSNRAFTVAYPAGDRFSPNIGADEILRRAQKTGPLRLIFVGNVIPRKGLHILLQALEALPTRLCQLTVVGRLDVDKAYSNAIRRRIERGGLGDSVHLSGSLSEERLTDSLRSSQLLVVPSFYEGFGIVYLEGMSFGLPAIASSAGAAHEIITHGQNGYLVPPGDARALAEILATLAHDRQILAVASLAARKRYLAHPTWEQTAGRIRSFLATFAGTHRT
jgi:glycosyltransferase involved in cell wall biosynthesis